MNSIKTCCRTRSRISAHLSLSVASKRLREQTSSHQPQMTGKARISATSSKATWGRGGFSRGVHTEILLVSVLFPYSASTAKLKNCQIGQIGELTGLSERTPTDQLPKRPSFDWITPRVHGVEKNLALIFFIVTTSILVSK